MVIVLGSQEVYISANLHQTSKKGDYGIYASKLSINKKRKILTSWTMIDANRTHSYLDSSGNNTIIDLIIRIKLTLVVYGLEDKTTPRWSISIFNKQHFAVYKLITPAWFRVLTYRLQDFFLSDFIQIQSELLYRCGVGRGRFPHDVYQWGLELWRPPKPIIYRSHT